MARPTEGPKHARKTEASRQAQTRLELILETLTGTKTVAEACEELGINEARFHVIRKQALQAAAERLEPQRTGRPPKEVDPREAEVEALKQQLAERDFQLQAARIKAELAIGMPQVMARAEAKRGKPPVKKKRAPKSQRRRRRRK